MDIPALAHRGGRAAAAIAYNRATMSVPRLAVLLLAAACWLGPAAAETAAHRPPPAVQAALREAGISLDHVAILVQDVDAAAPRLAVNTGRAFNPASVMKLLPTYAALELLGPAYTWTTTAQATGPVAEGILDGDLYLQGSGDPKLGLEQFWLFLRQLRAHGIRDIRGDLVLDRSAFLLPPHDPAAFDGKPQRPYNVGPDALLVAHKTLRIELLPAADGRSLAIAAEPQPVGVDILNLIRPGDGPACGDWKEALRADLSRHGERTRLILTGEYPAACGEKVWNLGVLDHPQFVEGVFRQLWTELGGRLDGGLREGRVPAGARVLASAESPPLAEIVRDINKFSNNVMARQLYLGLGLAGGARPARPEDGEAAIRAWLQAKRLACPALLLENGAGLSRRERIDADCLGRLLAAAWRSPMMAEFIASLPLLAVDGTMKKRLNDNAIAGQAHIKSGSLEGVRAIAGYVQDRRGRWQIVAFLINDAAADAARAAQDALLQWVYER